MGRTVEKAEETLKNAIKKDEKSVPARWALAKFYLSRKRVDDAERELLKALELDPKDIVSYTNRGEIYMQHGLIDDAETDFKSAAALDPYLSGTGSPKPVSPEKIRKANRLLTAIEREFSLDEGIPGRR
jgi:tetratricopeptide (TPR) repeat protein